MPKKKDSFSGLDLIEKTSMVLGALGGHFIMSGPLPQAMLKPWNSCGCPWSYSSQGHVDVRGLCSHLSSADIQVHAATEGHV